MLETELFEILHHGPILDE